MEPRLVMVHESRPPPAEFHATTDFDGLCHDAAEVTDLGLRLPGPVHPSRRLCLPLLVGVACVRCLSTSVAEMLDRLPGVSYGVAKEHHVLDFPHRDVPLPWPDHTREEPTALGYAAGFPLCEDELGFDFTPGLLSEKQPYRSALRAKALLPANPTLLVLVPEPLGYLERRLQRGVDVTGVLRNGCRSHAADGSVDCRDGAMQMAWLEACVGIDPNPNAKRFSNVPEDCGATLIQRARVFSSACPFAGLQEWLRAGFEAKHFAFLPSAEVASGDAVRAREVALELAELMGAGVRSSGLGSGAPLDDGLSAEAFAVHANSSYGLRGEVLYGASCVSGGAARVRQEEDMAAEVQRSVAEGRQREPPVEPRRQSGLGFGPELRRRLGDLYDGHCAAPLAAWLGVDMDRLYGRVLPELTPEQRGVEL